MVNRLIPQAYAACADQAGQGSINLGDCLTLEDGRKVSEVFATPGDLINTITRNLFIFAGIIIFLMIIYAGFQFISGASKGKEHAREVITSAIVGIIVMFSAFWILQIVKIVTGINFLGF